MFQFVEFTPKVLKFSKSLLILFATGRWGPQHIEDSQKSPKTQKCLRILKISKNMSKFQVSDFPDKAARKNLSAAIEGSSGASIIKDAISDGLAVFKSVEEKHDAVEGIMSTNPSDPAGGDT